jgi:hypothetical protein
MGASSAHAQKEQLIRIFEGLITKLKKERVDESAQNFAPIVESGSETLSS